MSFYTDQSIKGFHIYPKSEKHLNLEPIFPLDKKSVVSPVALREMEEYIKMDY
jgi:hypothetical protein